MTAPEITQMSKEDELAWIQESMKEITAMDVQAVESSEELQKMLAVPALIENSVYKFDKVEIKYRKFMTRQLRALLSKAKKALQNADDPIKEQDDLVYHALAEMCVDNPYNTVVFWHIVDNRSTDGRVYKIFMDLIKSVGGSEQSLKTFQ